MFLGRVAKGFSPNPTYHGFCECPRCTDSKMSGGRGQGCIRREEGGGGGLPPMVVGRSNISLGRGVELSTVGKQATRAPPNNKGGGGRIQLTGPMHQPL